MGRRMGRRMDGEGWGGMGRRMSGEEDGWGGMGRMGGEGWGGGVDRTMVTLRLPHKIACVCENGDVCVRVWRCVCESGDVYVRVEMCM